jgi:hypothetical protein
MSDDDSEVVGAAADAITETSASAKPKRWSRSENEEFFVNIMIRCEVFVI